ncbi:PREDICTED: protein prune homolog isoform X2 [Populus euphratica]|uniref:Protein prune homolog isoform X2 n=1 Tax=Populus euphratica TaxID=75702 RepID=A0AAJ6V3G4_POPEU|nr:PREDICTED: protein prune homolog isoform X2 [Populus euphratica]
MRPPKAKPQDSYIRGRENPYFAGLLRGNDTGSQNISPSTSDTGDLRGTSVSDIPGKFKDLPVKDSVSDILEPFEQTTFGTLLKVPRSTSFESQSSQSDMSFDLDGSNHLVKQSSPGTFETTEEHQVVPVLPRPMIEKSFVLNKRKSNLSNIPLPQSAATFYNGFSPQFEILESCESTMKLNLYLKARKDDVSAGVPGKFLRAVIGQDVSDVGSIASTIMYALYLNETIKSDQFCTVPIINMKRTDLSSHAELKWLLDSCHIDVPSLLFVDEIDLSYFDLFGCLKLVLVNGHKLPARQEALKEAVVEVFNCRKDESVYPWVETVTVDQDCSCCSLIAEKLFLTSPELLAGQRFSKLLLAGILMDTGNLTSPHCTTKDKYMATLLLNGAGRFGSNGLYQIMRYKMYDISDLKVVDILRKDFKKWTRGESEKLRLLMIVSGYYDAQKNFKREILVSAESVELMRNLLSFFSSNASHLPLKAMHGPSLRDDMKAFEIDEVTSRKTIERLLEEFGGASKG